MMRFLPRITTSDWVLYNREPLKPVSQVLAGEWRFFTHVAQVRAIEWLGTRIALSMQSKPLRIHH